MQRFWTKRWPIGLVAAICAAALSLVYNRTVLGAVLVLFGVIVLGLRIALKMRQAKQRPVIEYAPELSSLSFPPSTLRSK